MARRSTLRAAAFWSLPGLALVTSCLFSTTPPQRNEPNEPPPDPSAYTVGGTVRLRDRVDRSTRLAPGHPVRINWIGADRDQNGQPDVVLIQVVSSDKDATYEATTHLSGVTAVEVEPRLCIYDPIALECCFDQSPCSPCAVWAGATRGSVTRGARAHLDLQVWCP